MAGRHRGSISMPIATICSPIACLHPRHCTTRSHARLQVVVDEEPLGHRDLGVARLHPHHMRHDRREIRALGPSPRPRTADCRPAARRGASTCDMSWSGLPCRATLLRSKVASAGDGPPKRVSGGQGFGAGPDLGHTVRVALSRVSRLAGAYDLRPNGRVRSQPRSRRISDAGERALGRHTRARGSVNHRQVNSGGIASATGLFSACGSRPGPSMGPLVVR